MIWNKLVKEFNAAYEDEKNVIITLGSSLANISLKVPVEAFEIYDDSIELSGGSAEISINKENVKFDEEEEEYYIETENDSVYLHFCKKV